MKYDIIYDSSFSVIMADPYFLKKMETDLSRKQAEIMVLCRSIEKRMRDGKICKKSGEICVSTVRKLNRQMTLIIEKSTTLRLDIKWTPLPQSIHTKYLNKYERILKNYNTIVPHVRSVCKMLRTYLRE